MCWGVQKRQAQVPRSHRVLGRESPEDLRGGSMLGDVVQFQVSSRPPGGIESFQEGQSEARENPVRWTGKRGSWNHVV